MGERLDILVDIPTQQAVENLQALLGMLGQLREGLQEAGRVITKTESELGDMAAKSQQAGQAVVTAGQESAKAAADLKKTGEAAEKAGQDMQDMGRKGKKSVAEIKEGTGQLTGATEALMSKVMALGGSYLGLQTVANLLREMAENAERTVKARQSLGDEKLSREAALRPLLVNFSGTAIKADRAGLNQVMQMASEFEKTTGQDDNGTRELLSAFQANGFDVTKQGGEGMKMATSAGIFATRTGASAQVAGQFAKIAALANVRNEQQMLKLLAQIEAAFANTPINDPSEFYGSVLRATANRLQLGIPVDQALAQLSAAAQAADTGALASTNVNIFRRIAAGDNDDHRKLLGRAALERGLITPAQVQAGTQQFQKTNPQYEPAAKDRLEAAQVRAEQAELRAKGTERDMLAQIALDEAQLGRERGSGRRTLQNKIDLEKAELPDALVDKQTLEHRKATIEADRKSGVLAVRQKNAEALANARQEAARAKQDYEQQKQKEDYALQQEGMNLAYMQVPPTRQEQFLYDLTTGSNGKPMSKEQILTTLNQFAAGEQINQILGQLLPAGRARREQAAAAAGKATAQDTLEAQRVAMSRPDVQSAITAAGARGSLLNATHPGAEFATDLMGQADAASKAAIAQGDTQLGFWSNYLRFLGGPFFGTNGIEHTGGGSATHNRAVDEKGLQARQMMTLLRERFDQLYRETAQNSTLFGKWRARLDDFRDKIDKRENEVIREANLPAGGSSRAVQVAQKAAQDFGELMAQIQADFQRAQLPIPAGTPGSFKGLGGLGQGQIISTPQGPRMVPGSDRLPPVRPAAPGRPTTQPLSMSGALPDQLASAGGGWDYTGGLDPALAEVLAYQIRHAPELNERERQEREGTLPSELRGTTQLYAEGEDRPLSRGIGEAQPIQNNIPRFGQPAELSTADFPSLALSGLPSPPRADQLRQTANAALRHWEAVTQNPLATRKKIKAAYDAYRQARQRADAAEAELRHMTVTNPPTGKIYMRGPDGRMQEVDRPAAHSTPIPHHAPTGQISYRDQAGGELKTWPGSIEGALPLPEGATPTGVVAPADHDSGHASAGPTYNVHIGMMVTQPDGDLDLPGRFQ